MNKTNPDITCVLDASALMALINQEPGAKEVQAQLHGACISTVNWTEVLSKMVEHGVPAEAAHRALESLGLNLIDFDPSQGVGVATLRSLTKSLGLSLADRICLNLGQRLKRPVFTCDKIWATLSLPNLDVRLLR